MFLKKTSLIQTIIKKAEVTFSKSQSDESFSTSLTDLLQSVNNIQPSDLSINLDKIWNDSAANNTAPIVSIPIFLNKTISMNVFALQDGSVLPLHDHPGMYGIIKVIHGTLGLKAYNPVLKASEELEVMTDDIETKTENLKLDSGSLIPVKLHMCRHITSNDYPCLLTPMVGNYHEIRAVNGTAAMFDILAPPYSSERECNMYSLLETHGPDSECKMWLSEKSDATDYWYQYKLVQCTGHKDRV